MANSKVDSVLAALKMFRAVHGSAEMWALVPRGVEFLAKLLEEIDGIGEEFALEIALKVAMSCEGGHD